MAGLLKGGAQLAGKGLAGGAHLAGLGLMAGARTLSTLAGKLTPVGKGAKPEETTPKN